MAEIGQRELGKQAVLVVRPRIEPGQFRDHQSLSSGNATVRPKLIVVCGAIGAYCRYAIHCPVTKRLIGGSPGRTNRSPEADAQRQHRRGMAMPTHRPVCVR